MKVTGVDANLANIISKQNLQKTVYQSDRCQLDLIYFKVCGSNDPANRFKRYLDVMHSHSMIEFHLVLDGEMDVTLETGKTISLKKGYFTLISPSLKHAISRESEPFKKILISFELIPQISDNDEFYNNFIHHIKNPGVYKCSARMTKLFNVICDTKKDKLHDKNNMIFELAVAYIMEVCNVIVKKNNISQNETIADKRVDVAIKFIRNNISLPLKTSDVAKQVYVSSKQLTRIFNYYLGQTPADFIKMEKNKYVCKLLTETNLSLADIAESAGFSDTASLIKRFKSIEGITPAKYRSTVKKNKY